MNEIAVFIHYGIIALSVSINSIGVSIGESISSNTALEAINRQPQAHRIITRAALLGMALIETIGIIGVFIAIMLLSNTAYITNVITVIPEIGIAFAVCLPGFILGIVSALPVQEACNAIARQPLFWTTYFKFYAHNASIYSNTNHF